MRLPANMKGNGQKLTKWHLCRNFLGKRKFRKKEEVKQVNENHLLYFIPLFRILSMKTDKWSEFNYTTFFISKLGFRSVLKLLNFLTEMSIQVAQGLLKNSENL